MGPSPSAGLTAVSAKGSPDTNRRGPGTRPALMALRRSTSTRFEEPRLRSVVNPLSRYFRAFSAAQSTVIEGRSRLLSSKCAAIWTCMSIKPGMTVNFVRSTSRAPCGTWPFGHTETIRPSWTTMTAPRITFPWPSITSLVFSTVSWAMAGRLKKKETTKATIQRIRILSTCVQQTISVGRNGTVRDFPSDYRVDDFRRLDLFFRHSRDVLRQNGNVGKLAGRERSLDIFLEGRKRIQNRVRAQRFHSAHPLIRVKCAAVGHLACHGGVIVWDGIDVFDWRVGSAGDDRPTLHQLLPNVGAFLGAFVAKTRRDEHGV